jgi:hypothetical protein
MWADSVCINQQDLEEQGQQVRLMGGIYSKALLVIILLEPDHSSRVREIFRTLKLITLLC